MKDIKTTLELHRKWLATEPGGERGNLRCADLTNTNLKYANLKYADLTNADLTGAKLKGTRIAWALGNGREIITILAEFHIVITRDAIAIGCEQRSVQGWRVASEREIFEMHLGAEDFHKKWRSIILNVWEKHFSEYTF